MSPICQGRLTTPFVVIQEHTQDVELLKPVGTTVIVAKCRRKPLQHSDMLLPLVNNAEMRDTSFAGTRLHCRHQVVASQSVETLCFTYLVLSLSLLPILQYIHSGLPSVTRPTLPSLTLRGVSRHSPTTSPHTRSKPLLYSRSRLGITCGSYIYLPQYTPSTIPICPFSKSSFNIIQSNNSVIPMISHDDQSSKQPKYR